MNNLPEDILNLIYQYIPYHVRCLFSAKNYLKYNSSHQEYLRNNVYGYHLKLNKRFTFDTYVRKLIKNDYYYVFQFVLKENYKSWKKTTKKNRYKNMNYRSKLLFYSLYCIENKANKCLEIIRNYSFR